MASEEITEMIQRWGKGDQKAASRLFPLIYEELRRMARRSFREEAPDHTLQPTALVHELFLKLAGGSWQVQDRQHFYAIAARQMRRILIDHARAANAHKRGRDFVRVDLPEPPDRALNAADALALDEALTSLEALDERVARGVELRYFGGMNEDEIAETLNISVSTFKRDLQFARAWLRTQLDK